MPSEQDRADHGLVDGDPAGRRLEDDRSGVEVPDAAADSVGVLESDLVPSPHGAVPAPLPPEPEERPGDHDGWTLAGLQDALVGELSPALADGVADATLPSQALLTESPGRGDARMALSVICAQGHANPTNYVSCRTCGVELSQPARMIACPALGRLVVSSGGCVELDRPVLVGRMPSPQEVPQLAGATPSIVRVPSPEYLISRNHLLIELEEWSVLARSLSSSNGTTLRRPGAAPMRLTSAETVLLASGDVLDLGDGQSLVLEDLP